MVGEVAGFGEEEVRGDVAAGAGEAAAAAGDLADGGAVAKPWVGAGADLAVGAEGDRAADSEADLARLAERAVVAQLERASADRLAGADLLEAAVDPVAADDGDEHAAGRARLGLKAAIA